MGLFDIFKKKKKEEYDPNNIRITDLKKGFMLDYDMKTWEVKEMYEYDWGDNFFSFEYKLDCGDDVVYLSVEQEDDVELSIMRKVKIRAVGEDLPEEIAKNEVPPKKLNYNGLTFYKDGESPGYFRNMDEKPEESTEFISWDYYDESEKNVITIEQWGEREFEAAVGIVAQEYEFSNILPSGN